jgi:hypothetical protein
LSYGFFVYESWVFENFWVLVFRLQLYGHTGLGFHLVCNERQPDCGLCCLTAFWNAWVGCKYSGHQGLRFYPMTDMSSVLEKNAQMDQGYYLNMNDYFDFGFLDFC